MFINPLKDSTLIDIEAGRMERVKMGEKAERTEMKQGQGRVSRSSNVLFLDLAAKCTNVHCGLYVFIFFTFSIV